MKLKNKAKSMTILKKHASRIEKVADIFAKIMLFLSKHYKNSCMKKITITISKLYRKMSYRRKLTFFLKVC